MGRVRWGECASTWGARWEEWAPRLGARIRKPREHKWDLKTPNRTVEHRESGDRKKTNKRRYHVHKFRNFQNRKSSWQQSFPKRNHDAFCFYFIAMPICISMSNPIATVNSIAISIYMSMSISMSMDHAVWPCLFMFLLLLFLILLWLFCLLWRHTANQRSRPINLVKPAWVETQTHHIKLTECIIQVARMPRLMHKLSETHF